jgi:hypothetical protein
MAKREPLSWHARSLAIKKNGDKLMKSITKKSATAAGITLPRLMTGWWCNGRSR